jgi:phosphoserine phosphatase
MRHVVTLIASPESLLELRPFVTALGQYDSLQWLEEGRACDITLTRAPDGLLRSKLQQCADAQRADIVVQPLPGREKKLLISDMDSTMIDQECIDELADCVGLKAHVAAITERAMRGELDFAEALRERVGLLTGLATSELERTYATCITPMAGAKTLLATMKARGAYAVLVSGGFTFFTTRVAALLGFDAQEANQLLLENNRLTGTVADPILDKHSKRTALLRYAAQQNLAPADVLAVGDGANDLPMLLEAGLGVAYHAKPLVVAQARAAIRHNDLTALLFAQGIAKRDWVTTAP